MGDDVSTEMAAILPFVVAAVLVGVFILWRPPPLHRLIARHGGSLQWAALLVAIGLGASRGILAGR